MKSYELKKKNGSLLPVESPFIIVTHHIDLYPKSNGRLAPSYYLENTKFGDDFKKESPFRMYHGKVVPGFPAHPHRGFETVTLVLDGYVDHTDSLGSKGRYAKNDVQWMTAGKGIQHCEMFPLLDSENENRFELIQIWLNLPKKSKFVDPYYQMLWREDIPVLESVNEHGKVARARLIAGSCHDIKALKPNPDSWASDEKNAVKIMLIELEEGATLKLRGGKENLFRMLYQYEGIEFKIDGDLHTKDSVFKLSSTQDIYLDAIKGINKFLLVEGMPIDEPVYAYGPFVMNTEEEVIEAYKDFRETQFGGWPFEMRDPVHPVNQKRFAKFPDGSKEEPDK